MKDALWVVSDADLLLHPQTVVTPDDIQLSVGTLDSKFDDLSAGSQKAIEDGYFAKMLTGSDWVDLISRRIALRKSNRISMHFSILGEIKVFDSVDVSRLAVVGDPAQKQEYEARAHSLGFVVPSR